MSAASGKRKREVHGGRWWPEDITTDILSRLREPSSIARFRCVSKLWRRLLSQHEFVSKTLYPDDAEAQLMIARSSSDQETTSYSIHSYEAAADASLSGTFPGSGATFIAGCTDGIFCISDHYTREIALWNPTTSETKVLPSLFRLLVRRHHHSRVLTARGQIGFGLDPVRNDYKVLFMFATSGIHTTCVYSLNKDSWRHLDDDVVGRGGGGGKLRNYELGELGSRVDCYSTSRIDKCHWWQWHTTTTTDIYRFTSFDMSREKFTSLTLPTPAAAVRPRGSGGKGGRGIGLLHVGGRDGSCLVAVYYDSTGKLLNVWVALDYAALARKECSWIRLYNVRPSEMDHGCCLRLLRTGDPPVVSFSRLAEFWKRDKVFVRSRMSWIRDCVIKVKYLEFAAFVPSTVSL